MCLWELPSTGGQVLHSRGEQLSLSQMAREIPWSIMIAGWARNRELRLAVPSCHGRL